MKELGFFLKYNVKLWVGFSRFYLFFKKIIVVVVWRGLRVRVRK